MYYTINNLAQTEVPGPNYYYGTSNYNEGDQYSGGTVPLASEPGLSTTGTIAVSSITLASLLIFFSILTKIYKRKPKQN